MKEKKERKIKSSIVRDSLDTFGTNAFGSILGFISAFVVLNRVNPEVKGLYNQVITWGAGFTTILSLSINSAVIYYVSRYTIKNTKKSIQSLTISISIATTLISAAVMVLMRSSPFFLNTPAPYLLAIVVYSVSSFVLNICTAILRGENKFKSFNMINLVQRILVTVLAIVVFLKPSAAIWVWGTIGISLGMILFASYFIARWNGTPPEPAKEDDFPVGKNTIVKYSLKSHISNVMTYVNTYVGSYIVQGYYGLGTFAVYNVAITMMQQVWIIPDAVSQVIMSRIAAMREQDDKVKLTLMSSKIVTYITTVSALLLLWVAKFFVPIIFPMYVGAVIPLSYLIVGSIFITYAKVLNNSIAAYGRPELNIIPTILGIAANLLFSFLLIPSMSMNGVALATSISLTVQGLTSIIIFCRFTKTPFYRLLILNSEEIAAVKHIFIK